MEIPDELKYLAPYIQRGQELNNREPIVAYYGKEASPILQNMEVTFHSMSPFSHSSSSLAHYYAVKLAISRGPSNKATQVYLSHLLDSLEVVSSPVLKPHHNVHLLIPTVVFLTLSG
jgi:vacuolar protein sorting-associated protein VTA1